MNETHDIVRDAVTTTQGQGLLAQGDAELPIETYPFDTPEQVASYWTLEDTPERLGSGEWIFQEFWHLDEIADELGCVRRRQDNWRRPVISKGAGRPMEIWQAELARDATHYHTPDLQRQGKLWLKAYHDAWKRAEQEFHRYISRGVPSAELMKAYREAEQGILPEMKAKLDEIPEARFRLTVTDDGEDVEIDRYINAEPELWIRPERMKARKRAVTIAINLVASGQRKPAWFANMIAGVVVIGNYLIKHGYEVRLLGVRLPLFYEGERLNGEFALDKSGRPVKIPFIKGFTFPLIDFGQRFDPVRILTWGHPAVVRYFGFGWCQEIYGNKDGDVRAKTVHAKQGAGRECKLTGDTPTKLGIDWMVTPLSDFGDKAQELLTQVGPVLTGLWKVGDHTG
jgi:hypothetical protein